MQMSLLPDEATQFSISLAMDDTGHWHWRVVYGSLQRGFRDEWRESGIESSCAMAIEVIHDVVCRIRLSSL